MGNLRLLGLCVGILAAPYAAGAATCVWTGGGTDDNWSTAANWDNCGGAHATPQNNDNVIFGGGGLRPNPIYDVSRLTLTGIQITGLAADGHRYVISNTKNFGITLTAYLLFASPPFATGFGPAFNVPITLAGGVSLSNLGTGRAFVNSIDLNGFNLQVIANAAGITVTGTISGSGSIGKTGSQFLSLEGSNTFTGEVYVNEGTVFARTNSALGATSGGTFVSSGATLKIDGPITSIPEPLTLRGGGLDVATNGNTAWTGSIGVSISTAFTASSITVGNGTTLTVNGPISGAFKLVKGDVGTMILNGDNSAFIGSLEINGGVVYAKTNTALGDAAHSTIVGPSATLALDAAVTIAETLILNGGRLSVATNGNTLTGVIGVAAASSIDVGLGSTFAVNSLITGTSALTKVGLGTLALGGASPGFTGAAVVQAGVLSVNGSLANSAINITGGTLGGTGTVGPVTATSGGVNPGNSPGILNIGNLTLNTGTTLTIELAGTTPGSGYDQLRVTGTVNLANATLLPALPVTPAQNTVFTIIDNDGSDPVVGTFNGLPEGATVNIAGYRAKISYIGGTGNDVTLSLIVPQSYYLSEGATGGFFDEDVLIANPNTTAAPLSLIFLTAAGTPIVLNQTLPAQSRTTVHVDRIPGLESAEVSTVVTSTTGLPLAVERSMFWDSRYYAGHTGSSVDQPSQDWVFAEGSQGFFNTYVLLANANATPADVTLTFLREGLPSVVKTVTVPASARFTVDCGTIPAIVNTSFGITVHGSQPIIAERAMYFGTAPTRLFSGGHESAGVTAPARSWFLAEGATGGFFDTFVLLSNPQSTTANVTVKFLLDTGETVTESKTIPANQRLTINIEAEPDPRLKNAAVSTVVSSDVPIVVERSMYWIGDLVPWTESHNSFGVVDAGTHWGLAEGRVGQALNFHTYILLANPQSSAATATVTFLRENGAAPIVKTYTVPPTSRFNIDVNNVSTDLHDENVAADVRVTNGVPIVVERSMYWDSGGVLFKGGTNATGVRLP